MFDINSQLKTEYIRNCTSCLNTQIEYFSQATEAGSLPPFLVETAKVTLRETGLDNPERLNPNRFIVSGNYCSLLPDDFTEEEKLTALKITPEANTSGAALSEKLQLKNFKFQPVMTIFLRSSEIMHTITCPGFPEKSGIISRTRPLLFNYFNLEAAKFAEETYGKSLGRKISQFSYEHEAGHLIFAQHLAASRAASGASEIEIPSSWYRVYQENEIFWELWANQLPNQNKRLLVDSKPIFPYWIAKQGPDYQFDGKTIYDAKSFGVLADKHTLHYPPPHDFRNYPFVMDPADAQEYIAIENYIREIQDPLFPWLFSK